MWLNASRTACFGRSSICRGAAEPINFDQPALGQSRCSGDIAQRLSFFYTVVPRSKEVILSITKDSQDRRAQTVICSRSNGGTLLLIGKSSVGLIHVYAARSGDGSKLPSPSPALAWHRLRAIRTVDAYVPSSSMSENVVTLVCS